MTEQEWEDQPHFEKVRNMRVTGNCDVCGKPAINWFRLTSLAICGNPECKVQLQKAFEEQQQAIQKEQEMYWDGE